MFENPHLPPGCTDADIDRRFGGTATISPAMATLDEIFCEWLEDWSGDLQELFEGNDDKLECYRAGWRAYWDDRLNGI